MTLRRKYNYEKYWKKRGKHYLRGFAYSDLFLLQEKNLLELLRGLRFNTVFELGCGFGRITKLIKDNFEIQHYTALDISKEQIENAKSMIKDVTFITSDFMDYFTPQRFDLVLTSEVLMHIPPSLIEKTVTNLLNLSLNYVVCVESRGEQKLARHVFSHDYHRLFSQYSIRENKINGQSIYFIRK
jgi:trans-aconitate methyltransferase